MCPSCISAASSHIIIQLLNSEKLRQQYQILRRPLLICQKLGYCLTSLSARIFAYRSNRNPAENLFLKDRKSKVLDSRLIAIAFYFFPLIEEEIKDMDGLRFEYGRDFNLGYIILFSPYKQVGGLLFGLVCG